MSTIDNLCGISGSLNRGGKKAWKWEPSAGIGLLFLVPIVLAAYESVTVFVILCPRYWFDWLTVAGCFLFFSLMALVSQNKILRLIYMGLILGPVVVFYQANQLYFRFFSDRMPFDVIYQISDVPHIRTGIESIYRVQDVVCIIGIPMLLGLVVVLKMPGISWRPALLWTAPLAGFLLLGQYFLGPADRYANHEPLALFVREGCELLNEKYNAQDRYDEIGAQRSYLYPLNTRNYMYAKQDQGLFLRTPTAQPSTLNTTNNRPNIVLIVMESVRAYESGTYGANVSFTPNLDALAQQSLVASNYYANGFQTVRSEFSLLTSHYPNLGRGPHYLLNPSVRLITLPMILRDQGYSTLWISSYTADFEQKRRFLLSHGIQRIYDSELCPKGKRIGWGPDDATMLNWGTGILDRQKQPFFAEVMTLSNHFPFNEFPTDAMAPSVSDDAEYGGYTRGIKYTDWAVGEFLRSVRTKPWFDNTIFIVVGDHGLFIFPKAENMNRVRQLELVFRVPMMIYSPRFIKPGIDQKVASHVDVAPTILDLLGIQSSNTFLGRSLFDETNTADRFSLMVQQNNWVMRRGNRYYYGGEKQEEKYIPRRPSDAYGGSVEWIRGGFSVMHDLLRHPSSTAVPLPQSEYELWSDWGRKALLYDRMALSRNWALR